MAKEGYKPTSGMQSAARRAIKLKEQGKAKGAGTAVGWTRAGQLARGETLSLSTVKRMYSYFSRHEVDKKGKDWDNAENPSNGKIMWLAWGGDAGFSWSRKIVNREKNMKKSLEVQEVIEEIKDMLEDVINPVDTVVEIPHGYYSLLPCVYTWFHQSSNQHGALNWHTSEPFSDTYFLGFEYRHQPLQNRVDQRLDDSPYQLS